MFSSTSDVVKLTAFVNCRFKQTLNWIVDHRLGLRRLSSYKNWQLESRVKDSVDRLERRAMSTLQWCRLVV